MALLTVEVVQIGKLSLLQERCGCRTPGGRSRFGTSTPRGSRFPVQCKSNERDASFPSGLAALASQACFCSGGKAACLVRPCNSIRRMGFRGPHVDSLRHLSTFEAALRLMSRRCSGRCAVRSVDNSRVVEKLRRKRMGLKRRGSRSTTPMHPAESMKGWSHHSPSLGLSLARHTKENWDGGSQLRRNTNPVRTCMPR